MTRLCPRCQGRNMSSFIRSARTGLWNSTCRDCWFTDRCTTPPEPPAPIEPEVQVELPESATPVAEPRLLPIPKPETGAMARFEAAYIEGTLPKAIRDNLKQIRAAAADDGRAKQLGGDR